MISLALLTDPVPLAMAMVPQVLALLLCVLQNTIRLLMEQDVLHVHPLVLKLNMNQQLVRQLRIVFVLPVLQS